MPHRFHNALVPLLVAALAGVVVFAEQRDALSPQSIEQWALPVHQHSVPLEGGRQIDVTIASAGSDATVARLTDTTTRTLRTLSEWLGPPQASTLTVVDLPWTADAPGASYSGLASTRMRWLAPVRDVSAERSLIAALARQFWFGAPDAADASFREGLTLYTSTKAIHRVLEGRDFEAPRFFGGFVPFPLGSLQLSPNLIGAGAPPGEVDEVIQPAEAAWRFAPVATGSPARRTAAALWTLERIIGWPAMQQVLGEVRSRSAAGAVTADAFVSVAGEQRGVSMAWFARDLVRSSDAIDYAVGSVTSDQSGGRFRTEVQVERRGSGMFSGTDQPRSAAPARSFTVMVRFADGTEARAGVDGREVQTGVAFDSQSRAIAVAIDPDELVLVDQNRSNNVWAPAVPTSRLGLRLVVNWVIWLQHVMLTYTAIA